MEEKIKKSIDYKVLIKSDDLYFTVGTIVIKTYSGDIYYSPSQRAFVGPSQGKKVEHLSWHASGRVHIKHTDSSEQNYLIVQKNGERQKISEIGFQEMIHDTIDDYSVLPQYTKKLVPLDVVLDSLGHTGSVCFTFSIVSGKLIVATSQGQKVGIKAVNRKEDENRLSSDLRALGHHSGSGDIILQYYLRKIKVKDPRTGRRLFIPYDMKITKMNVLF